MIDLACETCGRPTGISIELGDLQEKFPDLKPDAQNRYLHGMCDVCKADLAEGCTFFRDRQGRCMKATKETSTRLIGEEFRGKVVMIPEMAMEELIRSSLERACRGLTEQQIARCRELAAGNERRAWQLLRAEQAKNDETGQKKA